MRIVWIVIGLTDAVNCATFVGNYTASGKVEYAYAAAASAALAVMCAALLAWESRG